MLDFDGRIKYQQSVELRSGGNKKRKEIKARWAQ
jgi:hypothetical protein